MFLDFRQLSELLELSSRVHSHPYVGPVVELKPEYSGTTSLGSIGYRPEDWMLLTLYYSNTQNSVN